MNTKNLSTLARLGKAPVTIFQGEVASGKSNAIMQTIAMNPETVVVFLNGNLWSDYIRSKDTIVRIEDSDTIDNLADQLPTPITTNGNRIFMDIDGAHEEIMPVIAAMVKENPDREYIFILNNTSNNSHVSLDFLGKLTPSNTRIYIETQCSLDIDRDILRTMDRVLFKTLNANVKLLYGDAIEKERAVLECGEALYISENAEICKIHFSKI